MFNEGAFVELTEVFYCHYGKSVPVGTRGVVRNNRVWFEGYEVCFIPYWPQLRVIPSLEQLAEQLEN